jgi:hypothetical protein
LEALPTFDPFDWPVELLPPLRPGALAYPALELLLCSPLAGAPLSLCRLR